MTFKIINSDVMDGLRQLPDESVHCVVTSPPYWGLRDYGTATWDGGNEGCDHLAPAAHGYEPFETSTLGPKRDGISPSNSSHANGVKRQQFRETCGKCGAQRIDQQIGLEDSPEGFVGRLVEVFREVRRVLRDDGTLWLNLGDSYANDGKWGGETGGKQAYLDDSSRKRNGREKRITGLKPKDLVGIPWRVAFALQADGWYLRSDIIWAKPNPMPESVTDRPTKSHEYVFLLTKSERYFYDAEAIKEPAVYSPDQTTEVERAKGYYAGKWAEPSDGSRNDGSFKAIRETRNKRSVWNVATAPFAEAHFATFPPSLIEPMILAGTSQKGCCGTCGAPWERLVGRPCKACGVLIPTQGKACGGCGHVNDWKAERGLSEEYGTTDFSTPGKATPRKLTASGKQAGVGMSQSVSAGWSPSCNCDALPVPCTVLDPFSGAGTTCLVADRVQRHGIGIELNPAYAAMSERRISDDRGGGLLDLMEAS